MAKASYSSLSAGREAAPRSVVRNAEAALQAITSAKRPGRTSPEDWSSRSSAEQLQSVTIGAGPIALARADVRNVRIFGNPERSDFPTFSLPNNVGARGFSPGLFTHDYLVVATAPATLVGPGGLAAIPIRNVALQLLIIRSEMDTRWMKGLYYASPK